VFCHNELARQYLNLERNRIGPMANERGSIRQNRGPTALPDLCNPGVTLRVVLAVNALALLSVLLNSSATLALAGRIVDLAMWVEPILIASLLAVCASRPWLDHVPYRMAFVVATAEVGVVAWGFAGVIRLMIDSPVNPMFALFWAALTAAGMLYWLGLAQQAREPALAEARLMALTSRIRPHFLFNSLNAILGVIRADPRRAESALEQLAELFRTLMQDPRDLVLLSDEIELARHYLELERLRLGDRLKVEWDVESCPPDALMPSLMLQPLLENAVYHGVEPADQPGAIAIRLAHADGQVRIVLTNPLLAGHVHAKGNQMALANIRERLMLLYDLEASLVTEVGPTDYTVRITIPYRKQ
jgi:two-component system, LytTR family, sensor histidine kinase AlgZ